MMYDYKQFYRRKLRHFHPPGAIFFVTLRFAGSIPKAVLAQWKAEKKWLDGEFMRIAKEVANTGGSTALNHEARLIAFHKRWFKRFEEILHASVHGPTWLKDSRIAKIVANALELRNGGVYRLDAYCIMSNHVHVVLKPLLDERSLNIKKGVERPCYESEKAPLSVIMHSLKSYTAQAANKVLGRTGSFWETESYDHFIRDEQEYRRVVAYVLNNPVKAGLVERWDEWRWSWKRQQAGSLLYDGQGKF
jgi:REP element-mobilizing transposase RayT